MACWIATTPGCGEMATWTLPWPTGVTTNHLYEGMGRWRHLTDAACTWRDDVMLIVHRSGHQVQRDGLLRVNVEAHPPRRGRHDLDNLLKLLLDAVCGALGVDDSHIVDLHIVRGARVSEPYLMVELLEVIG
jgi:Holliday junction resolvase RusA-like endonuclease